MTRLAAAMTNTTPTAVTIRLRFIVVPILALLLPRQRILSPLPVQQFLDELDALELHQPRVSLDAPIQRHADLPRPSEGVRVPDRRLVDEMIWRDTRVALGDLHLRAGEVARPI